MGSDIAFDDPRYELVSKAGEGAFGAVWRAVDRASNQQVAIKFIHASSADMLRRFDVEVQALQRVSHVAFVRPIDAGVSANSVPYLVTEFVEGPTLGAWLENGPSLGERLRVATAIAEGLVAAHREGVVHRDLKPQNIIVGTGGPKIVDFGIAKLAGREQPDITKTGEVIGTPGFMSPEQLRGLRQIGPATDMYAFGALLYEMLEGHPPFAGETPLQRALNHLQDQPQTMQSAPPELSALTLELLDQDPARRPTAAAVVRRLRGDAGDAGEPRVSASSKSKQTAVLLCLLGLIAIALVVITQLDEPASERLTIGTRELPTSLARPAHPDLGTPKMQSVDVGRLVQPVDVGRPEDLGSAACPDLEPMPSGPHAAPELARGAGIYLPDGYTPRRRYPVVVFFHDFHQEPKLAVENVDYSHRLAAQYVFVFPIGNPNDTGRQQWRGEHDIKQLKRGLEELRSRVCLDTADVVAIGHGRGGRGAARARCAELVRAVATFGYRFKLRRDSLCDSAVPELQIFPMEDPTAPVSGRGACNDSHHLPIAAQLRMTQARNDCSGEPQRMGQCVHHNCRTPFRHCEVPGSRHWRASYNQFIDFAVASGRCPPITPTKFAVTEQMLEFFEEVRTSDSVDLAR